MLRGLVVLAAASAVAALASPARAQLVCPPGLYAVVAANGSAACSSTPPQALAPAPAQAQPESSENDDGQAGGGNSQQGREARRTGSAACAKFNAEFTPFYEKSLQRYRSAGEQQQIVADRLRGLIASAQALRDSLRRQAMENRSFQVRAMLLQQARGLDQDIAAKQRLLSAQTKHGDAERAEWRRGYKERFQEYLKKRPAGCKVEALAEAGQK